MSLKEASGRVDTCYDEVKEIFAKPEFKVQSREFKIECNNIENALLKIATRIEAAKDLAVVTLEDPVETSE